MRVLFPTYGGHVGLSLTGFELFSWLQKRFYPPARDTMTNTALEATASSSGKNDGQMNNDAGKLQESREL